MKGPRVTPAYGPLRHVRVLDTGRVVAGPWAATILGDFGAEVIHIEGPPFAPPYADPTRVLPPLVPVGAPPEDAVSESWIQYSRNKLSLGLDVTRPEGRALFLDLVRRSDIWIDASRPGTFAKFDLSDRTALRANPRLVIAHVSGFGQTGRPDYLQRPSYDLVAQAFSGFLASQGSPPPAPPTQSGTAINDLVTGLAAALGSLMAYAHARETGKGQVVDTAQYEIFFLMMENMALDYFLRGAVRGRHGNAHPRLHPYDIFPAKDGWIVLAAPTPRSWKTFRAWAGLPDTPEWNSMAWRVAHREEVNERIRKLTRRRTLAELETEGLRNDIAFAPILTMEEIARNPHYAARKMLLEWKDPVLGPVQGAGIAPKLSATPGKVWRGAPWLGQDNTRILRKLLGRSPSEVRELGKQGVLGTYRPRKPARRRP
jgi:crotonobetainyl-CoA:carnitine CoA-transferase CaiB-like acyl-CoA transferase